MIGALWGADGRWEVQPVRSIGKMLGFQTEAGKGLVCLLVQGGRFGRQFGASIKL